MIKLICVSLLLTSVFCSGCSDEYYERRHRQRLIRYERHEEHERRDHNKTAAIKILPSAESALVENKVVKSK